MSNVSTEPKPQAPQEPQAAPDGNAIASLILGILGITVLPFIASIPAVILGRVSIGDAYKRGERDSYGWIHSWMDRRGGPRRSRHYLLFYGFTYTVDNTHRVRDSRTFCLGHILHMAK